MKFNRISLVIACTLFTTALVLSGSIFPKSLYSQVLAQTPKKPVPKKHTQDLRPALKDLVNAIEQISSKIKVNGVNAVLQSGEQKEALNLYQQVSQFLDDVQKNPKDLDLDEYRFRYNLGVAYLKLGQLAEQLGQSNSDSVFHTAQNILETTYADLKTKTDGLHIFSYTQTKGQSGCTSTDAGFSCTWGGGSQDSGISFNSGILEGRPSFLRLQEVAIATGQASAARKNKTSEETMQYEALLASEVSRTLSVDHSIASNIVNSEHDDKLTKFAKAFAGRLTIENIKQVARSENATIVSYSIISDRDKGILDEIAKGICNDLRKSGITSPRCESLQRPPSSDKLFIWVIQPNGNIKFVERPIPFNLSNSTNNPECKSQESASEECRVSKLAMSQAVRGGRQAIGVDEKGQQQVVANQALTTAQIQEQDEQLKKLYTLLVEPIEDALPLNDQSQIVFIPDGALFFVPFAALKDSTGKYLIEKHTISTAPNFRTLLLARSNQTQNSLDNKDVLVAGNPTNNTTALPLTR